MISKNLVLIDESAVELIIFKGFEEGEKSYVFNCFQSYIFKFLSIPFATLNLFKNLSQYV